ncbi:MAG TPA: ATP-binding cassette domain-containing protein [Streptosporangiaceae bacterium]|nr:ATP-binding cassette domain-containing protein [Streptosporangiaceae bacterium]
MSTTVAVDPHNGEMSAFAEAAAPVLSVSGLEVSYGLVRALDGVTLSVRSGELVALAGENGAGKTTLVRCVAGDIAPSQGQVVVAGRPVSADPRAAARAGVAVVWQDLALCDNLDVAANILLGQESPRLMWSESRFHATAASLLADLDIPLRDTTRSVRALSGGQRQLVAVARAMSRKPRLLALDEPTASLGVQEAAQVEKLIMALRDQGTTILLACHDIDQMFRLADRIVVLRQGRIVADLVPASSHPDDVAALLSGQRVDSSARRQLTRLHGLADRLVSADPSSSLSLILSALGAALRTERLCIHLTEDQELICAATLGFAPGELAPWTRLPLGAAGGPVGLAAAAEKPVLEDDVKVSAAWLNFAGLARVAKVASSWSVPVMGPGGLSGVITVFRDEVGLPERDELDLVTLYAGYAASAIERDRLLDQVTARNRVLETIREMLQTLAGPVPVAEGLVIAVQLLRHGLQADEVALLTLPPGEVLSWRAFAGPQGTDPVAARATLRAVARQAMISVPRDGVPRRLRGERALRALAAAFTAPGGPTILVATWERLRASKDETALMEDAAHSLRLALEREEAGLAHQEAAALRRSRELQRGFLSRLSHELRTPLTAIRGYASSLLQPDVTWDRDSQERFLDRIAAESARLGRLVDDLLDFSAIESGTMRLQHDWCDIPLVLEAAIACLPPDGAATISVACDPGLPVVWADHDRLEQVFVNLLSNAVGHNPPGTRVQVTANAEEHEDHPGTAVEHVTAGLALDGPARPAAGAHAWPAASECPSGVVPPALDEVADDAAHGQVVISVTDDGTGMPAELAAAPFEPARRRRSRSAGAGLGLSIASGIVSAHGGHIELRRLPRGTSFRVYLPVDGNDGLNGRVYPMADGHDG